MSILGNPLWKQTATAETDVPMLGPEQVVDQLRGIQVRIPEYVQPAKTRAMRQILRRASVNIDFAREAISAVGASDTVQHVVGNTPAEFHAAADEIGRWATVESELRAMLRGVVAANIVRRERLGLAALQVYNVSRELVRREEHAALRPYVEAMSRMPKYNRRRKASAAQPAKPADPAKAPVPATPPKAA
jgi:hypothetical protein